MTGKRKKRFQMRLLSVLLTAGMLTGSIGTSAFAAADEMADVTVTTEATADVTTVVTDENPVDVTQTPGGASETPETEDGGLAEDTEETRTEEPDVKEDPDTPAETVEPPVEEDPDEPAETVEPPVEEDPDEPAETVNTESKETVEEGIPAEVQAFFDAVARIPAEITMENLEEAGESVNAAVDAYEFLYDVAEGMYLEREDVQGAYAVVEAACLAVQNLWENIPGGGEPVAYAASGNIDKSSIAYNFQQFYWSNDFSYDGSNYYCQTTKGKAVINDAEGVYDVGIPWVNPRGGYVTPDFYYNPTVTGQNDIVDVEVTYSGNELKIAFKPGSKTGSATVKVAISFRYTTIGAYAGTTADGNLYFWYDVTNNVGGNTDTPSGDKPAPPTDTDVQDFYNSNIAVIVRCVNRNDAKHNGSLSRLAEGSYTIGEVEPYDGSNGDLLSSEWPWMCKVHVDQEYYLNMWLRNFQTMYGTHYLKDADKDVFAPFYYFKGGYCTYTRSYLDEGWYCLTKDAPVYIDITESAPDTTYKVIHEYYTNDAKDGEIETTVSNVKAGETVNAANIQKKTTYNGNEYTYKSADPTSLTLAAAAAGNIIRLRYERTAKITDFEKTLVKTAEEKEAAKAAGVNLTDIDFPASDGHITFSGSETVTLLYKITFTGTPGMKYTVTDSGATWAAGPKLDVENTLGATGTDIIYVTRGFTAQDIDENGNLVNTAMIIPETGESKSSTETTPAEVEGKPELEITKTITPDTVEAGEEVTYTITVKNTGNSAAENVFVTDVLNENLTFVKADNSGSYVSDTRTVTWTIAELQPGEENAVKLTLTATAKGKDKIENVANAKIGEDGTPTPSNTVELNVKNYSIKVEKFLADSAETEFNVGDKVRYRVVVTNTGNSTLYNTYITDVMDPGLTMETATDPEGINSGAEDSRCVYMGQIGTPVREGLTCREYKWNLNGEFKAGESVTLYYTAIIGEINEDKPELLNVAYARGYKAASQDRTPETRKTLAKEAFISTVDLDYVDGSSSGNGSSKDDYVDDKDGSSITITVRTYSVTYSWNLPEGTDEELPTEPKHAKNTQVAVDGNYPQAKEITVGTGEEAKTYVFSGWSSDDVIIAEGTFIMPGNDVIIHGFWTEKQSDKPVEPDHPDETTYTVTWVDGWSDDPEIKTEIDLAIADIPDNHPTDPTREGYIFIGWEIGEPDENGNIIVTAQWREETTDPEDPTNPTDPEEPTNPTDPEEPTNPTDPEEPTNPTDPEETVPEEPVPEPVPANVVPEPVPIAPVVPVVTPVEPTDVPAVPVESIEENTTPLAESEVSEEEVLPVSEEIEDEVLPLAEGRGRSWALVNFALMNLAVFETLMLLIGYFVNTKKASEEEEEEQEKKLKKKGVVRLISLPVAVISVIAFCLTEDITLPTGFVDRWTLLMAIIAVVQTVVVALSRKKEEDEDARG